jgi:cation-transporting ATPase 13A3/4/5
LSRRSFRFYEDGLRFVGILAILAACGFIYTIVVLNRRGVKAGKITVRGLDLITTVSKREFC